MDNVEDLGDFREIEAISENDSLKEEKIKQKCNYYKSLFQIQEEDLIKNSYSDLLLSKKSSGGRVKL